MDLWIINKMCTYTLFREGLYRHIDKESEWTPIYPSSCIIATCISPNVCKNGMLSFVVQAKLFILAHGGWSAWTRYTSCSVSCNGGSQTRRRTCTKPSPLKSGRRCLNKRGEIAIAEVQQRKCNWKKCPRKSVVEHVQIKLLWNENLILSA